MKKINPIYYFECIIFIFVMIFGIFLKKFQDFENIISIIFWLVITVILLYKYGFYKDNNYLKKYSIRLTFVCILSLLLILYMLGFLTGYSKTVFIYKFIPIIKNVIPIILVTILEEIIRHIVCRNSDKKILPVVILSIIYLLSNVITEMNYYVFNDFKDIFRFFCSIFLPLFAKEALYSYITYNISLIPTTILKVCFNIYPFIFPIYPVLNDYLMGMIGVIVPFTLYILNRKAIFYNYKNSKPIKTITTILVFIPIIVVFGTLFILSIGITDYKLMAIASNSMKDVYQRGDAIIYYQFKNNEIDVKEGHIIVFNKNGKVITHRIVDMRVKDGKMVYTTKGDNNEIVDNFDVYNEDIIGLVKYKIEYIGYPSVLLSELISR